MRDADSKSKTNQTAKKPYQKATLKCYGTVAKIIGDLNQEVLAASNIQHLCW